MHPVSAIAVGCCLEGGASTIGRWVGGRGVQPESGGRILIASPTYDGSVRREYMRSVMLLTEALRSRGLGWELLLEPATLLHTMRSVMASLVVQEQRFSHLLFVDTDLDFQPASVLKMLEADQEVIGCAYPYRTIPLHEPVKGGAQTLRQLIAARVPYAVSLPEGVTKIDVVNGICEVASIGTGLLLIRRTALESLVAAGAVMRFVTTFPYSQWYGHSHYHGFFSHLQAEDRDYGEDYSFCRRWRGACGGLIHALVTDEVAHIGPMPVLGSYSERLRAGGR